jgi:sugar lactone lactonase YvrE
MPALKAWGDRLLGRGDAAITVPVFDGALKSNQLIEDAAVVAELDAPEDVASDSVSIFVADGARVLRFGARDSHGTEVMRFERPVTALACLPGGGFAVALDGKEIRLVGGAHDGRRFDSVDGQPLNAVNALSADAGRLLATDGSKTQPVERWKHDLMSLGRSGRLLEFDPASGDARERATQLAYAFGTCVAPDGAVWACESWRHRVLSIAQDGRRTVVLDGLPGYPSRIAPAAGGGYWLSAFILRTQLVEFVLREPAFRKRMLAEIEPPYWIAPALNSGNTFLEPMQGAHLKMMGIVKPWAPPRSYGLVIRLNEAGLIRYSLHSRFDGRHHGIVAAVECGADLYLLSKGRRRLLRLDIAEAERSLGVQDTAPASAEPVDALRLS